MIRSTRLHLGWLTLVVASAAACGGDSSSQNSGSGSGSGTQAAGGEQHGTVQHESNMADDGGASGGGSDASTAQAIVVEPLPPTLLPSGLQPTVRFTAPRDNSTVTGNRVEVRIASNWNPPQDGRHIHLILDNEPYRRVDDVTHPVVLENLAEGTHVLRAFPGWHTHESVKTPGAFAMLVFNVGHPTAGFNFDRNAPLLTYSRPKGDYNGTDADSILLDFYLTNVRADQLGESGYRVGYTIDGTTSGYLTQWAPFAIDHLADGSHTISLNLVGPDGQIVPGMFNHTERTINVNHSAPADHGHPAAAGGDGGTSPGSDASATGASTGADSGAAHAHH